jgi:hypothetical protein
LARFISLDHYGDRDILLFVFGRSLPQANKRGFMTKRPQTKILSNSKSLRRRPFPCLNELANDRLAAELERPSERTDASPFDVPFPRRNLTLRPSNADESPTQSLLIRRTAAFEKKPISAGLNHSSQTIKYSFP